MSKRQFDSEVRENTTSVNDPYPVNEFGAKDYSTLKRKQNAHLLPLWVAPDGLIYFETFNKFRQFTQDFLIAIAEPVSRPQYVHTYMLTDISLYAAVSSGIKANVIINTLGALCKTGLPNEIVKFIEDSTRNYGKANLVLRHGKMKIESENHNDLKKLINDRVIANCVKVDETGHPKIEVESIMSKQISSRFLKEVEKQELDFDKEILEFHHYIDKVSEETIVPKFQQNLVKEKVFYSVEIIESELEKVKKRCIHLNSALLSEYDFLNDEFNPDIKMELKSITLRPYQEKCLRKMFIHNRARSGIIVLPCGAGKTLVGVSAACNVKKRCIVFTTSSVVVDQWKSHFVKYTTIDEKRICRFTGSYKDTPQNTEVFITTYNIIGYTKGRSEKSNQTLEWMKNQEWGLIILDEVHTTPATTFRSCLEIIHGHCILGLTATMLREDDKIADLNFLVGPKLYEADWMELQDQGFIARVQCVEILCSMDPIFVDPYEKADRGRKDLLCVLNPEKFRLCQFLINFHENRGDKILVFSDNLFALRFYATKLNRHLMEGETEHEERTRVMDNFKNNPKVSTLFVSKVADVALDLPEANVLIQISFQGASRRQEAQRLGRITRAKKDMLPDEINAFFYTIVTKGTSEQAFIGRRQQFLKDQGYAFKVMVGIEGMPKDNLMFTTNDEKMELLKYASKIKDEDCLLNEKELKKKEKDSQKKKDAKSKAMSSQDLEAIMNRKRKELFNENVVNNKRFKN